MSTHDTPLRTTCTLVDCEMSMTDTLSHPILRMHRRLGIWLLLAAPSLASAQERYGFVAMLGRDTIAVERIVRTGTTMVSDAVERFPRVVVRHTEVQLGANNAVQRLSMDIFTPTFATPKWRQRTFTAEQTRDSVRVTVRNGDGVQSTSFATRGELWVPWSSQLYSLTELYVAAALAHQGETIQMRNYYPDQQTDEVERESKNSPGGLVRRLPGHKAEISRHDGLSGAGEATMDAQLRMTAYSGARSTFKTAVVRIPGAPDVESIAQGFTAVEAAKSSVVAALSVRDTARGRIGSADFQVDYGRPLARGRTLVGEVLPFDAVWRTGANAATQFTTSAQITLAGLRLDAGTYSLWTLPSRSGVSLIVNRQTRQWGTQYDSTRDLGRAPVVVGDTPGRVEQFTISFTQDDATHGAMVLEWGSFRWTAPITIQAARSSQSGSDAPIHVTNAAVAGDVRPHRFSSNALNNTRMSRVLVPRGYDAADNASQRDPVLYLADAQNLFDPVTSDAPFARLTLARGTSLGFGPSTSQALTPSTTRTPRNTLRTPTALGGYCEPGAQGDESPLSNRFRTHPMWFTSASRCTGLVSAIL